MKITKDGTVVIYEKFFSQFKLKMIFFLIVYALCCLLIYLYNNKMPLWFYLIFLPVSFLVFVVQRDKVKIDGAYITDTIGKRFKINEIFSVNTGDDGSISVRWLKEEPYSLLKEGKDLEDYVDLTVFLGRNFNDEDLAYLTKLFAPYKENYLKYYPDYTEHCRQYLANRPQSEKNVVKKTLGKDR